jgi:protein-tyrosine-phosphatase/predicted ATP-grasp superfamily ATP-dependent carboligase
MRILVTDAHELAGLGAIRSLGRAGHQVIAGYPAQLRRPASTYSRYCAAYRAYPDPWRSQSEFCAWFAANSLDIDAALPVSEAAIVAATSSRPRLSTAVALIVPPAASLHYTLSKRRATMQALTVGIPCPHTAFSLDAVCGLKAPYLVRTDNQLMSDGSYRRGRNWYIDDPGELLDLLTELNEGGEQWMVQEFVVGVGAGAFLLMHRGETLLEFAHERIHEVPFYGGHSSLRKSVRDAEVIATAKRLLTSISYEGVAMVEFRRSSGSETPYFVEINGRLWGSLALALHAGADFPARLVDCFVRTPVQPVAPGYREGIYCRNVYPGEVDYLRSVLTAHGPVRGVRPPGRARSILEFVGLFFVPGVHYDYLWVRDPLPCVWNGIRACGRVFRSRWNNLKRGARQRRLLQEFERRSQTAAPDLRAVLFLCYGNICRSAFACAYWNQSGVSLLPAESAGFYTQRDRRTPGRIAKLASKLGVELTGHRSRVVDAGAVERATAIFVMDGQNLEDLLTAYPVARGKSWLLGSFGGVRVIRDPYVLSQIEASEALRQVKESVDVLLSRLTGSSSVT